MKTEQIENSFTYHKPFGDQPTRYETLRAAAKQLAHLINTTVADSREKSLAMVKLEESVMWANKAIACNEIDTAPKNEPETVKADDAGNGTQTGVSASGEGEQKAAA